MQKLQRSNEVVWYNPEFISEDVEHCLDAPYWYIHDKIVGTAKGRGTTWFVQLKGMQAALRHYRRGGLFGKIVEDHYLFSGWEKTRSYQEFTLLNTLRAKGVNVPLPIAARAIKSLFFYRADLLSERIENASDLVDVLTKSSLNSSIYYSIGQQIRKLHNAQVNHTDLNIHNILLDAENKVWIIDFDKCCEQSGDEWKASNLERLKRSFLKEKQRFNIQWQEKEWEDLLEGYHSI